MAEPAFTAEQIQDAIAKASAWCADAEKADSARVWWVPQLLQRVAELVATEKRLRIYNKTSDATAGELLETAARYRKRVAELEARLTEVEDGANDLPARENQPDV